MSVHYIGVDIGGTNIKAARVSAEGAILQSASVSTPSDDIEAMVEAIASTVHDLRDRTPIAAVGIGVAGLLSGATRMIEVSPNIPCLQRVNLEERVSRRLALPVVTENDANAAAYGEWVCGAGRGRQHLASITLGTGLGCGLILQGRLFRGASGYAGELGHTALEPGGRLCACGSTGCVETRVSATAMLVTARERGVGNVTSAAALARAALDGDAAAQSVFEETGRYLGIACANLIDLLNLEAIVLGGGVMASGELLLGPAREEARRRAFGPSARDCAIVQSSLWPDAGTIGGAMLARDVL